jgi:vitamin B12 transporter
MNRPYGESPTRRGARATAPVAPAMLALLALATLHATPARAQRAGGSSSTSTSAAPAAPPSPVFFETATVEERPLASATAAVTVIDRETIAELGARSAADALRFVAGVELTGEGARGGLTTAQIRGGDPNFTLVLLDGVPLNDGTYPVGDVFDLAGLPASAIERIEVVRGPFSSFYGSTGLAGVINIFTRRPPANGAAPTASAEVEAGDGGVRRADASVAGAVAGGGYWLGISGEEEAGRVAEESFAQRALHGSLALPVGGADLRLAARATAWRSDDYPEASGGPRYGSGELRRSDHDEASLSGELRFGAAGREQKLTAAVYRHHLTSDSPAVPPQVPPSTADTTYTRSRLSWSAPLFARGALRLAGGVDLTRETADNRSILVLPPFLGGAVSGNYSIDRTLGGAYGELIVERGDRVLEIGSRFDLPEGAGVQWSPRLGFSLRPGDGATRFHAAAGRAFKLPSFFALASPPALGGNPELRPETVVGGDAGVERRFAAGRADAGVTLFVNRFSDLIDFDFDRFLHVNRSRVEARGAELTLSWRPSARWTLAGDATWQEVDDLTAAAPLLHRPRWTGGLRVAWRPTAALRLELDARGEASSFDEELPVPERDAVAGYGVAGLTASWRLAGGWRLDGRVDNLTDRRYEALIGFPAPGRSFRLGLAWSRRGE